MNMRTIVASMAFLLVVSTPCRAVSIEQYHSHDFAFRATPRGNPFDVDLVGDFSGPGGVRLSVPGFYDGDGVWKIRFSPTVRGTWSLRTRSSAKTLDGKTAGAIDCVPNTSAAIHGGLRVDPQHPHHFIYEDGTRYFLMGYEADWLWAVGMSDPQRREMHKLIDQIAGRGFNQVLVNVYAHDTFWAPGKSSEWDYGPPEVFAWEGSNEKPDHSRPNPRFFRLYDGMMDALRDKGIVAHIMFKVYNKLVHWPAPGSVDEERFFRYVTARYQAYSNVVWDFSKETFNEPDKALEARLINVTRSTDAYHRLYTGHSNDAYDWNPALNGNIDFRTIQQHAAWGESIRFERALRQWPVVNVETGAYERGVDDLPSYFQKQDWQDALRRAYLTYLAGGYSAYYYDNTAWDLVKSEPESPGARRFQLLKEVLSGLPYWRMEPADELAYGGPCLAIRSEVYACYSDEPGEDLTPMFAAMAKMRGSTPGPAAGSQAPPGMPTAAFPFLGRGVTINLRDLTGPATAEWIDTWTGDRVAQPVGGPGVQQFGRPLAFGDAPGLLVIRAATAPGQ